MKLRKSCIFKNTILSNPEIVSKTSVFFDIETTGLSWRTSHLYMIGCACFDQTEALALFDDASANCSGESEKEILSGWVLRQWFLEKPSEETELLKQFSAFLVSCSPDCLVHYNGTTFDIPYLRSKYRFYGMEDPFAAYFDDDSRNNQDLYQQIRAYKKIFRMNSLKQRDVEQYFGLPRDDCYTGGELIDVYQNYLRTADDQLLDCLWRHNFEDVHNLLPISAALYAYQSFFSGQVRITSPGFSDADPAESLAGNVLKLQLHLAAPLPHPLSCTGDVYTLHAEKNSAELIIPVYEGELRHFFSDYKNYYYLPDEDIAIHKSVGSFVDPAHRKKATADTCYERASGCFLPQFEEIFSPAFRHTRKDKRSWFPEHEVHKEENAALIHTYVLSLLKHLLK